MNHWIIADSHLGHKKLQEVAGWPKQAESKILRGLLKNVAKDDVLIHLGDVSLGKDSPHHYEITAAIRGKKILVRGNHDNKSLAWYYERGWDAVVDRMDLNIFGEQIAFSHMPLIPRLYGSWGVNIHGHMHSNCHDAEFPWKADDTHIQVSMEEFNFQPVALQTLIKRHQRR